MRRFVMLYACFTLLLLGCVRNESKGDPSIIVGPYDTSGLPAEYHAAGREEFEIGANFLDLPVFKNPDLALQLFLKEHADGFAAIQKAGSLEDFDPDDLMLISFYMTYGAELSSDASIPAAVRKQALEISKFLDIYENSFVTDYAASSQLPSPTREE